MDERTNFIVFCIEEYKTAKGMNGKAVIELFNQYHVIDYIRDYYEALHTTGRQYIDLAGQVGVLSGQLESQTADFFRGAHSAGWNFIDELVSLFFR